ncbi:unnamed protein product [Larinioides sclopetarius]|uniref:Uncharacterized protein n=1 Tax=Larinioides sclopetarius TaxID=280406 RepID=A0AAV2BXR0_9ARAC
MLHSKKSQSILQWYNSLTTRGDVNSLEQFTDGSHFFEIVASLQPFLLQGSKESNLATESVIFSETSIACNEEVMTSVEEAATEGKMETSVSESIDVGPFVIKESDHTDTQKKYDAIRKFIDDFYHVESSSLVDYGECQKGKELELAKVAVFLLSAMVQTLVSSKNEVVYNTTLLELEVQENIHECLALVLDEKDVGENHIKKSELHKVLSRAASYKAGTPVRKSSRSTSDPNDASEGVKNISKKRKERQSVIVYEDLQNSPLKNLLESPKIQYKAAILRKESELTKLRGALLSEENKVVDLTLEKQNLNDELEKKKKELDFYKKELQSQREALSEKEEQEKLRDEELKDKKIEAEKIRKLAEDREEEIKQLNKNNATLQEKLVDLEKRLEQDAATSLMKGNNCLKDRIQILELDNEEKVQTIKSLNEKITSLENELQKYQDFSASISRRELRSSSAPETLSTIIYADEQSRETLERKEQELRQDLETKDERIKRLAPQLHKGEISKNKSSNLELQKKNMGNYWQEKMCSLEKENQVLKEKLENYELKYGSTSDDTAVASSAIIARNLNSIKKESDVIESSTDEDNKKDSQFYARVSDDSKISILDSQMLDKGRSDLEVKILKSVVRHLEMKKCISPVLAAVLKEGCNKPKNRDELFVFLRDMKIAIKLPKQSVMTRSRSQAIEELESRYNDSIKKIASLENDIDKYKQKVADSKRDAAVSIRDAADSKMEADNLKQEITNLRQEVAIAQEKYINMEKLAKKKDDDVKKALIMYQRIVKLDKKDKDSKKECGEECEKLRRRCKQLNEECLVFEQETSELKRSINHLEGMMEHLQFEIKELNKEKKELEHKLWKETSALSRNTTDRDALVLHYLKKSKHEPKKNKDIELKGEEKKSSRPIVKVDAYILNSENEPSMSNSMLAGRSIRSSYFQVADEDDFLNESSLAEIHNGGILEGESGENRLLELQRRNTLCPPHLQSSYPLEIQNMTPSERKYYNPQELSFDLGRKGSQYNGKRDIRKNPKSKYMESDSDESDDSHSFPVKKRKISEADRISVAVSKKRNRPSNVKGPSKEQGISRKPSTPLKRVAAFVKRQSTTFITPSSVNRLMKLQRKSKIH